MLKYAPRYDNVPDVTNATNWLVDGTNLTSREAYLDWLYRAFGQMLNYFGRQVPPHLQLQIDLEPIRQSLFILDEDGQRISPKEWHLRPGTSEPCPVMQCTRAEAASLWEDHCARLAKFIPFWVCNKDNQDGVSLCYT